MAQSVKLSADLGQNWPSSKFTQRVAIYPVLQFDDFMLCRNLYVYLVSLSVIQTACVPSIHRNITSHWAGKYRSDYVFFSVPVYANGAQKAIARSNLGRNGTEALPRLRFGRPVRQEAV